MENILEDEKNKLKENLVIQESTAIYNYKENLFQADFIYSQNKQSAFTIEFDESLKNISLKYNNIQKEIIKYNDIIGAFFDIKSNILNNNFKFNNKKLLKLNFFPYIRTTVCKLCGLFCCNCCQNVNLRKLKTYEFLVNENDAALLTNIFNSIASTNKMILNEIPYKRNYIVLINPVGGKGKAIGIWNIIREIMDKSYINLKIVNTEYYKHAYDYVLKLDRGQCDGILCVSGDGIVHEVVNAILHRPDSETFNIPIGVIPAGTSNGLAKAICDSVGEECNPLICSYFCIKGQTTDIDLVEFETISSETKIYSFLSLSYGYIADVDLESEMLRCCGSMRYDLYGFWRLICLRKCFADFYYLPQENEENKENKLPDFRTKLPSSYVKITDEFKFFLSSHQKFIGQTMKCAPKAKINDGFTDLIIMRGNNNGKFNLTKLILNLDKGDYFENNGEIKRGSGVEYIKTKYFRIIPKLNLDQNEDEIIHNKLRLNKFYSIDGERYPLEPIQGRVLNKRLKVFCLNK